MMGYEEDFQQYISELESVYRRAMDAPLQGLTNEQAAAIKDFQFNAKQQKERMQELQAGLIEAYRNAELLLETLDTKSNEFKVGKQTLTSAEQELNKLRTGLKSASAELEKTLTALGIKPKLSDKDIVNPIDPSLPIEEKVRALQALSSENEVCVREFMKTIDTKYGTNSKDNHKAPDKIAEKARRPEILKKKPWHDVEHIRDAYRFKTVLNDLSVLVSIAQELKESGFEAIKIDVEKLLSPGMWGWRIVVFDLRMPNGQLVEYYLPVKELETAKNERNHAIFEKWRNRDLGKLQQPELVEYYEDQEESDNRYQAAWDDYLQRNGQAESQIQEWLEEVKRILE